jgi:hypothetical protein
VTFLAGLETGTINVRDGWIVENFFGLLEHMGGVVL